jgi:hypothetical protein
MFWSSLFSTVSMCSFHVIFLTYIKHRYFTLFTKGMFRLFNVRGDWGGLIGRKKRSSRVLTSLIFMFQRLHQASIQLPALELSENITLLALCRIQTGATSKESLRRKSFIYKFIVWQNGTLWHTCLSISLASITPGWTKLKKSLLRNSGVDQTEKIAPPHRKHYFFSFSIVASPRNSLVISYGVVVYQGCLCITMEALHNMGMAPARLGLVSELELELFLRPTDSRPVHLGIGPPCGTLDQILSCSSFFGWQLLDSSF